MPSPFRAPQPSLRLGFDIGGTFTDFVLSDPATGACACTSG